MQARCHFTFLPFYHHPSTMFPPFFPQLWPFHPQMPIDRGQVLPDFGQHERFMWTKRKAERQQRTRVAWREKEDCKRAGGRENEGEIVLKLQIDNCNKGGFFKNKSIWRHLWAGKCFLPLLFCQCWLTADITLRIKFRPDVTPKGV